MLYLKLQYDLKNIKTVWTSLRNNYQNWQQILMHNPGYVICDITAAIAWCCHFASKPEKLKNNLSKND